MCKYGEQNSAQHFNKHALAFILIELFGLPAYICAGNKSKRGFHTCQHLKPGKRDTGIWIRLPVFYLFIYFYFYFIFIFKIISPLKIRKSGRPGFTRKSGQSREKRDSWQVWDYRKQNSSEIEHVSMYRKGALTYSWRACCSISLWNTSYNRHVS